MNGATSAVEILSSRILIHPRDYDRSVSFYRDVIGLQPMREFGQGAGRGIVFFLGGGHLEITGRADVTPSEATELWLQVRDAASIEATLREASVPIAEAATKKPWGLVELRALDPDGLTLIFVEVPADHPLRQDTRSL